MSAKSRTPCLWHTVADGTECPNPAVKGISYCREHVRELEIRAIRNLEGSRMLESYGRGLESRERKENTYVQNLIVAILAAAGTASGQVIVDNWDKIWGALIGGGMFPPGIFIRGEERTLLGRFDGESRFLGYMCEPIPNEIIVERLLELARA